jgi:hypothetical protein
LFYSDMCCKELRTKHRRFNCVLHFGIPRIGARLRKIMMPVCDK